MVYQANEAYAPKTKKAGINNGLVWYAAIVPALGLFLENFAINKYLGILIWSIVIIMRPLCCLIDLHLLTKMGIYKERRLFALFPTVYIFKRCFALKQNTAVAVVCMICLSYGVIGNGFSVGLTVDDDHIIKVVQNSNIQIVSEFSEADPNYISDAFEAILDNASYSVVSDGDLNTITINGTVKDSGDIFSVDFDLSFDGFVFRDLELRSIKLNNTELSDEEIEQFVKDYLTEIDQSSASDE